MNRIYKLFLAVVGRPASFGCLVISLLVMLACERCLCTSVAFSGNTEKVIVAVDSNEVDGTNMKSLPENVCKAAVLGNRFVFVAALFESHKSQNWLDLNWRATKEADTAYAKLSGQGSLQDVAEEWSNRMEQRIASVYRLNQSSANELRELSKHGELSQGSFVGESKGKVTVLIALIELEGEQLTHEFRAAVPLPFSSNQITQQLMDGKGVNASMVAEQWKRKRKEFRSKDREWRWLQFMVRATEDYDDRVKGDVAVVEVERGKPPHWLDPGSCTK